MSKICPESTETDSIKFIYFKICVHTLKISQNNILEYQYTVARGSEMRPSQPGSLEQGSLSKHSSRQFKRFQQSQDDLISSRISTEETKRSQPGAKSEI